MRTITRIRDKGLCLGCGLCEAICGKDNVKMEIQPNGFVEPMVKRSTSEQEKIILA